MSLQEIDKMRIDGKFMDLGKNVPQGQYVLSYTLRRCYGILHQLLLSGEPVPEELMPIGKQAFGGQDVSQCGAKMRWIVQCERPLSRESPTPRFIVVFPSRCSKLTHYEWTASYPARMERYQKGRSIVMAHSNERHELVEMLKEQLSEQEDGDDGHDGDAELLDEEGKDGEEYGEPVSL
ncbi:hypothetical protein BDM02DRAFT_3188660 [Thelephora ganbajun]|uniref:Uncharacterized protein n=1 Tax=Thelephora ganbajun TaxID=370292 RepID=A0ACB6ZAV0_THEGA|nr:hypothetical protein BDM02DRAFT_3188660 [Thelephora ganbajun]